MTRVRLSGPAQNDIARILATSFELWGPDMERRYAALLAMAMRQVAAEPEGPLTRARADLFAGVRSFHLRLTRSEDPGERVRRPVHVIYYRVIAPNLVEIVRVLHERMQPTRHIGE